MKYLLLLLILISGCASKTEFGNCVGIMDDKDPKLVYKYSVRNIVIGSIFSASIFVPVLVVVNELQCPVGVK